MKKVFLAICIVALSSVSYAQKGLVKIGVGPDMGIPVGDFGDGANAGIGGYVKVLYGVCKAGQITLTSGYTTYQGKEILRVLFDADEVNQHIIPVLAGYRHNFSGFYVEPQIGYASYGISFRGGGPDNTSGAFTWATGLGYAKKGFEIGARYQSGHRNGNTTAVVGIHVGYNFSL